MTYALNQHFNSVSDIFLDMPILWTSFICDMFCLNERHDRKRDRGERGVLAINNSILIHRTLHSNLLGSVVLQGLQEYARSTLNVERVGLFEDLHKGGIDLLCALDHGKGHLDDSKDVWVVAEEDVE